MDERYFKQWKTLGLTACLLAASASAQETKPAEAPAEAPAVLSPEATTDSGLAPGHGHVDLHSHDGPVDWKKVPPIHVFPRPGYFPVLPKGEGYYSLADVVHGELRKDRPKYGYVPFILQPPPFFDIDWRYLEDPKTPPQDLLEEMHRLHLGENWLLNVGGEFRWRYTDETNSRLGGKQNSYNLLRTRLY